MDSDYKLKNREDFSDENMVDKLRIINEILGEEKTNSNSKLKILLSIVAFSGFTMAIAIATYMLDIFFSAFFNGGIVLVDVNRFKEGTLEFFILIPATILMYAGFASSFKKFFS